MCLMPRAWTGNHALILLEFANSLRNHAVRLSSSSHAILVHCFEICKTVVVGHDISVFPPVRSHQQLVQQQLESRLNVMEIAERVS
jgi:hypothetical protein